MPSLMLSRPSLVRQTSLARAPARAVTTTARQIMQGKVVSTASSKTAVVMVERKVMHPLYKKTQTKSTKFHVHDEDETAQAGDIVRIGACRPHSKLKRFELIEVCAPSGCAPN
ncbi:hypothetical protein PPROV_000916800 [Pycnococcus provasolii]|uniref:Small ribosomal subunit protein uS17c n=1 Tax=Pycnococcus provasolii TaxID=41880 RepID=A0A830HZX6_9CHLO|nr:hypothetical protein PPROV_000916800 [Pycnococcus provasolii]